MLKSHEREKLINAAVFFAERTNDCGKIKLIKLLYLLDFAHFRQTGRSVTGSEYVALQMGPVPRGLFAEWDSLAPDFAEAIEIVPEKVFDHYRERVVPRRPFDAEHFTPRELRIMEELAMRFRDDLSKPMVGVTHAESGPWSTIWDNGRGAWNQIPYALAVAPNDPHRDAVLESAAEFAGIRAAAAAR